MDFSSDAGEHHEPCRWGCNANHRILSYTKNPSGLKTLREILTFLNQHNKLKQFPGDGFEPPLEEPESSVLPLDDPGVYFYFITKNKNTSIY